MFLDPKPISGTCKETAGLPAGAADTPTVRRHFHFLLLPGANMLDFAGAMEPLRVANGLFREPVYSWTLVSETGGPVRCSNGVSFPVDGKLGDTSPSDCVVICSGSTGFLDAGPKTLQWLRRHMRFGGRAAALATGAFTLARAGLVKSDGLTLHWSMVPVFEELFPELDCLNTRTMLDDAISYSAGGSCSLDVTLSIIEEDLGYSCAQGVADVCIYDYGSNDGRNQRQSISKRVGTRHPSFVNILKKMEELIQEPASLDELIADEPISKRQVERLFSKYLNTTPMRYFRDMRLDRARKLLQGTDMPIIEIAAATGFASVNNFSKHYRLRFGRRPHSDREAAA